MVGGTYGCMESEWQRETRVWEADGELAVAAASSAPQQSRGSKAVRLPPSPLCLTPVGQVKDGENLQTGSVLAETPGCFHTCVAASNLCTCVRVSTSALGAAARQVELQHAKQGAASRAAVCAKKKCINEIADFLQID